MSLSVVVLGPGGVQLEGSAAHERPEEGLRGLDALLAAGPGVAIVTGRAEPCFFRASLALERGVKRVVVHAAALSDLALAHLALRARTFGGRVYLQRDRVGEHQLLHPPATAPQEQMGCPNLAQWSRALNVAGSEPHARAELGWRVSPELRTVAASSSPLALDATEVGFPAFFEELAWSAGLKPVLYLVVPPSRAAALRAKHHRAHAVELYDQVQVLAATGARQYGQGRRVVHLFLSHHRDAAEHAKELWASGSGRHARELGALMGYPACCVAAFEAFEERGHNAALVYVTHARTLALGAPFHPLLNGVCLRLVPFTPCSYGCPSAIAWAERLLATLPPALATAVRRALGRPVLYYDQARAVVLEAHAPVDPAECPPPEPEEPQPHAPGAVCFSSARWVPGELPTEAPESTHARRLLGALLSPGGVLQARDDGFEVLGRRQAPRRLGRGVPRLGVLLPFDPTLGSGS